MADGLRDLAERRGTNMLHFDPRKIEIEAGHNPRDFANSRMREKIDSLKTSISAQGVLTPLMVRIDAGRPILVDGETRLRACLELISEGNEQLTVPVVSVKAMDEAQRILLALTANTGEPLTQVEHGNAFQRLIGHGWMIDQIAAKVGHTKRYVTDALSLFDAPIAVKQMVEAKEVTPGRAISETKKRGTRAAETLREEINKKKSCGPLKREKAEPKGDLRTAVMVLLAETETQRDAMVFEIHRDTIHALKVAIGK